MNSTSRLYIISTLTSCLAHGIGVGILQTNFVLPHFPTVHHEKKVELELVDVKMSEPEKTEQESRFISDRASRARDRMLGGRTGAVPKSEGESEIKQLNESAGAVFSEQDQLAIPSDTIKKLVQKVERLERVTETLDHEQQRLKSIVTQEEQSKEQYSPEQQNDVRLVPPREKLFESMESSVEDLGDPSFAVQQNIVSVYLKKLRQEIFEEWFSLISIHAGVMPDSRAVIEFKILLDGTVQAIVALSYEGSNVFPELCKAAVQQAAPFDPIPVELPAYLKRRYLNIRFTFYYN